MAKKDVIFCDVDGTLCFHTDLHGVRRVGSCPDGTVLVTTPGSDRGYRQRQTLGIGDDVNDIGFLRVVGSAYVLASAFPVLLREARREGWTISRNPYFDGIDEILHGVLGSLPS